MIQPQHILFMDIETVPVCRHFHELPDRLQDAWIQKSLTLQTNATNPQQSFEARAGVFAEYAKIVCIGYGMVTADYLFTVHTLQCPDEAELLTQFAALCNRFFTTAQHHFCGHNIKEFDLPFICRRMLIHGIELPPVLQQLQAKKPWEIKVLDTLQYWKFGDYKNFISLDVLATILHIPSSKTEMCGKDVAGVYWQNQNLTQIADYCARDVLVTAQVWFKLQGKSCVSEKDIIFTLHERGERHPEGNQTAAG